MTKSLRTKIIAPAIAGLLAISGIVGCTSKEEKIAYVPNTPLTDSLKSWDGNVKTGLVTLCARKDFYGKPAVDLTLGGSPITFINTPEVVEYLVGEELDNTPFEYSGSYNSSESGYVNQIASKRYAWRADFFIDEVLTTYNDQISNAVNISTAGRGKSVLYLDENSNGIVDHLIFARFYAPLFDRYPRKVEKVMKLNDNPALQQEITLEKERITMALAKTH